MQAAERPAAPRGAQASAARAARLAVHPGTLGAFSIAIGLVAWEYAGRLPVSAAFPPFTETLAAAAGMVADGSLPRALLVTLGPLVLGVTVSAAMGIAAGVWMGLGRRAEWLGVPVFVVLQAAPLAAIIPLLVLAYGIGLATKVATVCVMAVPVIVLNSYKAIRHAPASLVEMGASFLASRRQLIAKVILPAASPVIFAGLRLGVAAGFIGAILAELLISPTGIGDLITFHQSVADYPKMYAAISTVILLSAALIATLERIEIAFFRPERRGR